MEFQYQPWKKIVIHEIVSFPLQHFLSAASMGIQQGGVGRPLRWVNGLILEVGAFRDTDDIIKEKLDGTLHYSSVSYAILEKFQPEFKVTGNIRVPIIDISGNKIFRELVDWLKNEFITKKE